MKSEGYWNAVAREVENNGKQLRKRNWLANYADFRAQDMLLSLIDKYIKINENVDVLDVGCGAGKWSILFAKKHFNVTGIDFSKQMIELAKKNVTLNGLRNIKFYVMNVVNLYLPDGTFDLVNSVTVLQHILDDQKWKNAISEIIRVTRNQGYLVIYEMAPIFTFKKELPYTRIRTMKEYVSLFKESGARLITWRGVNLSFPLTVFGLRKYSTSFNKIQVYYYTGGKIKINFLSFLSKLIAKSAKYVDYGLANTPWGLLAPSKIMLFQKVNYSCRSVAG